MDFTINGKVGSHSQGALIQWDQRSYWGKVAVPVRTMTPYLSPLALVTAVAVRKKLPTWATVAIVGTSVLSFLRVVIDKAMLPASLIPFAGWAQRFQESSAKKNYTISQFTLEVDGRIVEATLCKPAQESDRYLLRAVGNGETMHDVWDSLAGEVGSNHLQANVVIFNYPGVDGSSGFPHRTAMMHAYQALMKFLETEETSNGLGAKKIILWGDSIGGGCSGDALKGWEFKDGIKYVVVKRKSFSTMAETVDALIFKGAGSIIKLLGWNFDSVTTSRELEEKKIHEIIIQETKFMDQLNDAENVIKDGPISKTAALAYALLKERTNWVHKTFINDDSGHMGHNFRTPERVKAAIEMVFSQ